MLFSLSSFRCCRYSLAPALPNFFSMSGRNFCILTISCLAMRSLMLIFPSSHSWTSLYSFPVLFLLKAICFSNEGILIKLLEFLYYCFLLFVVKVHVGNHEQRAILLVYVLAENAYDMASALIHFSEIPAFCGFLEFFDRINQVFMLHQHYACRAAVARDKFLYFWEQYFFFFVQRMTTEFPIQKGYEFF